MPKKQDIEQQIKSVERLSTSPGKCKNREAIEEAQEKMLEKKAWNAP